jgi:two-component system, LytTR family, response regulator LytT
MKCIIIDYDEISRLIVRQLCVNFQHIQILKEFSDAIDAVKYLNDNSVDVIFLDIYMPTFSGFDFIKTLKTPPKIIITTSDRNFALKAFEYHCIIDYLVKPISKQRFSKAIEKASVDEEPHTNEPKAPLDHFEYLYVSLDRRLIKIDIPKIYLVEANGDYINIRTVKKNYVVHSTLKKIEEKLPPNTFLKVYRSFIINISEIEDIEDNSILIKKRVIPMNRGSKKELMKRINLL